MQRQYPTLVLSALAPALAACGSGGGGGLVESLLCGDGHDKSGLTLGLGLAQLLVQSDEDLKNNLNTWLGAAGVSSDIFSVASVSSVEADDTETRDLRFLKLEGYFAGALGEASGLVTKALGTGLSLDLRRRGDLQTLALLAEGKAYSFIQEGFKVSTTTHIPSPLTENLRSMMRGESFALSSASRTPELNRQWAYNQVNYSQAWASLVDEANLDALTSPIRVAVIDTGIDLQHPDLKDIIDTSAAKSFVDDEATAQDENGHGTHCAGIIAGQGGMVGVAAPLRDRNKIQIIPIKVLGKNGSGSSQGVQQGILWAIKQKADVISMSLGGGRSYKDISDNEKNLGRLIDPAIDKAIAAGIIVIVAAGNESCQLGGQCKSTVLGFLPKTINEYIVHPCSYDGTICVGATDPAETLASYSNYKSSSQSDLYRTKADVNAPGTDIYSTWPGSPTGTAAYKTISGTSMATPFVAGLAALLKANDRSINQKRALELLSNSQVYPAAVKTKSGVGRVDLQALAHTVETDVRGRPPTTPDPERGGSPQPSPDGGGSSGEAISIWSLLCSQ